MKLNTLLHHDIRDKKILLRTDFNVPIESGHILDNDRIKEALPTISYLSSRNNKIIIVSHLGRPEGNFVPDLVLQPVAEELTRLLGLQQRITKGKIADFDCYNLGSNIILLENIRFYPGEEKNDSSLAKKLSSLAEIFINDAFSVCHRAHASTVGVTKFMPSFAGFALTREVKVLNKFIQNPPKPFVCIIGGAKVETKMPLIKNLLKIADYILVGGKIGLQKFTIKNKKIILASDDKDGKDIGSKSIKEFEAIIKKAKSIFWNGTMGVFEERGYEEGTRKIAEAIALSEAVSLVGGGDTTFSLKKFGLIHKISYISTAGGATLEYLAGQKLPGLEPLMKK
jgi:phosphoglycerate kinase